jgi:hypothetical protein
MNNNQNQGSRPIDNIISSHEEDGFTVTISGPVAAPITASVPIPSAAGGSTISTHQDGEFTVTISGPTSPALSFGGDVTTADLSRGRYVSRLSLAGGGSASRPALTRGERHIVMDWSNISISAMNHCGGRGVSNKDLRINIPNLTRLLEAGCPVRTRYIAGSIPNKGKVPSYGEEFKKLGYTAEWLSRDQRTGTEKGVDSCLHAVGQQIVLDKLQKSGITQSTETLVLVTGDGNAHTGLTSFPRLVESAAKAGLQVEIWSWQATLSGEFARIATKYPGRVTIRLIDRDWSTVCYVDK